MEYTLMSKLFSIKIKKNANRRIIKTNRFYKRHHPVYEKIGLIRPDKQLRSENNYRVFSQETLDRLMLIRQVKSFGFTLKEIEEFLFLDEINSLNCNSIAEILENRLQKINEKITELQNLKYKLVEVKKSCTGNCKKVLEGDNG